MCVLVFFTNSVWNFSHSKKNQGRYDTKCILVFMYSTRYSCTILVELKFSGQIFEQTFITKFHENPPSGSRVVPCGRTNGRTDRRDEANRKRKTVLRMRLKLSEITKFYTSIRIFKWNWTSSVIFLSEGGDDVTIYLTGCWDMHSFVTNCWNISEKILLPCFSNHCTVAAMKCSSDLNLQPKTLCRSRTLTLS